MRGHRLPAIFFLGCLALGAGQARAAAPSLLVDLDPSRDSLEPGDGVSGPFFSLGRLALLQVDEPGLDDGAKLWATDGSEGGTRPLFDVCCASGSDVLGRIGGVGIFRGKASQAPEGVWRSDGTRAGTFPLAGDHFFFQPCGQSAEAAGAVYFSAFDGHRCGLWKTDGTVAGTIQLTPEGVAFERNIDEIVAAGPRAFFRTSDEHQTLWPELWVSDGTPEGTVRIGDAPALVPDSGFVTAGSRLFFVRLASFVQRAGLWTSDGTLAGTRAVPGTESLEPAGLQVVDGIVYFRVYGSGVSLWRSDGTAAGTWRVASFTAAAAFTLPGWRIEKIGRRLLFLADDAGTGFRWWTSEGRPASTRPLSGCPGGCRTFVPGGGPVLAGGKVFFQGVTAGNRHALWATDGTAAGTRLVQELCRGDVCSGVLTMAPLLDKLFFAVEDGEHPSPLRVTQGAPDGTRLVATTDRDSSWRLDLSTAVGGLALLGLERRSGEIELWKTDGTPGGTGQIPLPATHGESSETSSFVSAGSGARFLEKAGSITRLWTTLGTTETTTSVEVPHAINGLADLGGRTLLSGTGEPLWASDGTPAGTVQLTPGDLLVSNPLVLGERAVFLARPPASGTFELWGTDGTIGGTEKIHGLDISSLDSLGSEAVFISDDRLWQTDGTAGGTRPLGTLGSACRTLSQPVRLGSVIYFIDVPRFRLVCRTDGTPGGTSVVAPQALTDARALIVHRGQLYVMTSTRLWRSDGTEGGTVLLNKFVLNDPEVSNELTPFGDLLLFAAGGSSGRELWRTDGTPEGTFVVREIAQAREWSDPSGLTVLGGRLYFAASGLAHGRELWESDGTAAGTRLVQDIAPGAASSSPEELTAAGGRLYFTADDGVHGREPWVYAPGGAACVATETTLCLNGGRFKVEADWRLENGSGRGRAVSLTADTGYFWFFDAANVEVILKVLDGRSLNGHHWVFYGALSNVEYSLTVTDTQTGAARRYINPPGRLGSLADTEAFGPRGASDAGVVKLGPPAAEMGEAIVSSRTTEVTGTCTPGLARLCLQNGRFAVEACWKKSDGTSGAGQTVPLAGGDTGYFWFFDANNVEVVLKVLDGRPLNGKFWVFYGALSDVEYTLTVTDTETGAVKTYMNPKGRLASVADTGAF